MRLLAKHIARLRITILHLHRKVGGELSEIPPLSIETAATEIPMIKK